MSKTPEPTWDLKKLLRKEALESRINHIKEAVEFEMTLLLEKVKELKDELVELETGEANEVEKEATEQNLDATNAVIDELQVAHTSLNDAIRNIQ